MQVNLSLYKKRKIARAVLEGLHDFQHRWPERNKVYATLDSIANCDQNLLVMLRGHPGAGISSVLEAFSAKYHNQVIMVRPRLYARQLNMIGQVLHALFPLSDFKLYKEVPNSLIQFGRAGRKFIVIDDLDIISSQNCMHEVVLDQLGVLTRAPGLFTVIMSTRNTKLLATHASLKHDTIVTIPVSGLIPAVDVTSVIHGFYHWCNQQYGTHIELPSLSQFSSRVEDMPIDRIVHAGETLYCSGLLAISSKFAGKGGTASNPSLSTHSARDMSGLREHVECTAFV